MVEIGGHVVYWDRNKIEHDALVIHVWSDTCINLVWIDDLPGDSIGNLRNCETSVSHVDVVGLHRNCWT